MRRIKNLYHSKSEDFGEKGLLWIALIFLVMGIYFYITHCFYQSDNLDYLNKVMLIIIEYFYIAAFLFSVFVVATYFYIYSEIEHTNKIKNAMIFLYMVFFIIAVFFFLPCILIISIVRILVSYRAKRIDNLINLWIIVTLDILFSLALLILEVKTQFIECITHNISNYIPLNQISSQLFVLLAITEIVIVLFNKFVLYILYKSRKKRIQKGQKRINEESIKEFKPTDDIGEMLKKRDIRTEEYSKNEEKKLIYDIEYQERSLFSIQLFILIICFFGATFIDTEIVNEISTDLINVVTAFTLIILYIDKRNWNLDTYDE